MRETDVAIVGGGLAGSVAAAMLARAGIDTILIDPHETFPEDFRCEKFDASQLALLRQTGLADAVLPVAAAPVREMWIAARGRILERKMGDQYGFAYDAMVNAVRAEIGDGATFVAGKATAVSTGAEWQRVTLAGGEEISARVVVMANGLNTGVRQTIGMEREVLSPAHSISIGFDLKPVDRGSFPFSGLTYYPESTANRIAYVSFFPIPGTMRANFFVYRDMRDPWLREIRQSPREALPAAMPGLIDLLGDFEVTSFVKIRPVDLYVTKDVRRPGIVLIGDAFSTSCPAAGTGTNKALNDAVRLCSVHLPQWLASPGMDAEKIAAFYDDPIKQATDAESTAKAFRLRSMSTEPGLAWRARRWARLVRRRGIGAMRETRARMSVGRLRAAAGSGS
jgi:2-polyprenyl-6-methoxyphenol hydroxylase-like FAD-dependent oxidoreductase